MVMVEVSTFVTCCLISAVTSLTLAEMGVPLSLKSEGLRAWPLVHVVQAHLVGQVCCFDTPRKARPAHNRHLVGRGALTEKGLCGRAGGVKPGGLAHHGLGTLGAVHGSRWDAGPFV